MKGISFFEKYLTLWVILSIVAGIGIGAIAGEEVSIIANWEYAHVNIPVAILIWMMIFPLLDVLMEEREVLKQTKQKIIVIIIYTHQNILGNH